MEEPLGRLDCLESLLVQMVDQARVGQEHQTNVYALMRRNLGDNLKELTKLWDEFFRLAVDKEDKPPLKAVEE